MKGIPVFERANSFYGRCGCRCVRGRLRGGGCGGGGGGRVFEQVFI